MPDISVGDDAPPIVRILGVTLRRAASDPSLARRMDRLKGRVALRSTTDPQAATIRFDRGTVTVTPGVHADADVVISADLNTMGRPGAPKPKVAGALTHLRLALGAGKVLDPPVAGGWEGAAQEFWTWSEGRRGRPSRLQVVCTDDGRACVFGDAEAGDPRAMEIHGPGWALIAAFTGGDHLGAAVLEQRLQGVATLPVLSEFIGLASDRMFGED
jgi:hypothetical protein